MEKNNNKRRVNNNVTIIKYTKLYKHAEQYLVKGAHAPSNAHQRMGTASTVSSVKHSDWNRCREAMDQAPGEEPTWTVAIKEEKPSPATSHLCMEHEDHGI